MNAIFDQESETSDHSFWMTREGTPDRVVENLEVILIELPKMRGKLDLGSLWLRFMMEIGPEIREAIELAKEVGYSEAELYLYDRNWDAISRERTLIVDARLAGKAEGKVEGEALSNQKILQAIQGLEGGHDMQYVLATTGIASEVLEKLC